MTRMKRTWLTLAVAGLILLLPLILPVAFALHAIYLHRLRSAASRLVYTSCGQVLGRESLQLADTEWAKRMQEMRIKYPGIKFRVVRLVPAICSEMWKAIQIPGENKEF